jgi:hypothetical protein
MSSIVFFHFCVFYVFGTSPLHKRVRNLAGGFQKLVAEVDPASADVLSPVDTTTIVHSPHGEVYQCADGQYPSEYWKRWMDMCAPVTSPSPVSIARSISGEDQYPVDFTSRHIIRENWVDQVVLPRTISSQYLPLIKEQVEADHTHLALWSKQSSGTPNWMVGEEITPWGTIVIDESNLLGQTKTAIVFPINMEKSAHPPSSRPTGLVIKYQADPATRTLPLHSLMIDAWILRYLESENVTPKLYFLSPQFPTPRIRLTGSPKLFFHVSSQEQWEERFFRKQTSTESSEVPRVYASTVRFSVMEELGMSIHRMVYNAVEGRVPLGHALALGANMIDSLRKIHNRGVIHGDIHTGNICLENTKSLTTASRIYFIDFGRGFFYDASVKNQRVRPMYAQDDPLYSHWDIEGWVPGKRDDLFKIFLVISAMVNGNQIYSYMKSLPVTEAWEWKSKGNFLTTPEFNVFRDLSLFQRETREETAQVAESVENRIVDILAKLRSIDSIHATIDYQFFISQLKHVSKTIILKRALPPLP